MTRNKTNAVDITIKSEESIGNGKDTCREVKTSGVKEWLGGTPERVSEREADIRK